jgi:hypothetical protein
MDPGPFFYIYITIYCKHCLLSANIILLHCKQTYFFHTILLILCFQQTSEIDNLTVSWGKVVVLCAGSTLLLAMTLRHQLSSGAS